MVVVTETEEDVRDHVTAVVDDGDLDPDRQDETEAVAVQGSETTATAVEVEEAAMTTNSDVAHVTLWVQN